MSYSLINRCRVCGNRNLIEVLDLGTQVLTGVFPSTAQQEVTAGPLKLVKCHGDDDICHLLQLQHSFDLNEMYGENYGYRSGLNGSMVEHLQSKVSQITNKVKLRPGDLVIDIGSNDGTTLGFYPDGEWDLVGIDPTAKKFAEYYQQRVQLIADFFSVARLKEEFGSRKARIVTSFSMFYDLENPMAFALEIAEILSEDGIWMLEQSYMPTMLEENSYDTVCHEHLEYYGLAQIDWIMQQAGLKVLDIEFNEINGGSFSVSVALKNSKYEPDHQKLDAILEGERALQSLTPYRQFSDRVEASKSRLLARLRELKLNRQTIYGIGASTKGNVILQYCGITPDLLPAIGEVNDYKFGKLAPGSLIPIRPEDEILSLNPDYLLVLPWHFREFFENSPRFANTKFLYPL